MSWIFEPVTQVAALGALLGVGLIGSLALWLATKAEARACRKAFDSFRVSTETAIKELNGKLDELRAVPAPEPAPSAVMTVQGLNLTNRTRALRMRRRGESVASIAAALEVQQEEIELLLKLDRLLEAPAA